MEQETVLVPEELVGVRLDKVLSELFSDLSRSYIQQLIKDQQVLINGKNEKANYKCRLNDQIDITIPEPEALDVVPEEMDLDIVHEDDYVIVVNKPSGMVVHPAPGSMSGTLVNGLMAQAKNLSGINGVLRPGIVHRIDKDTSGIILVAKNNKAHEILADDFKHKRIKREYIALLDGVVPNNKIVIDAPIGRDNTHRKEMAIKSDNSKKAVTHLTVLKRYSAYTLVSLVLETGRTHQIRVHTAYIGYPVFNDPVYNHKKSDDFGQFLHSSAVTFIHPITKKELHFECPLPDKFQNFLDTIS